MKPHSFNLVREKWIPCADASGNVSLLSIYEALTEGTQWFEIRCPSPLQTVAVLRVLLAILYRACPVESEEEWAEYWQAKSFNVKKLNDYFEQWEDTFDLFSETHPFFQVAGFQIKIKNKDETLVVPRTISLLKLATELATDNNRMLFERATVEKLRKLTPAEAALNLLEIHAFGLGGGISSDASINGKDVKRPNFEDGAVTRSINLWFSGDNLFEMLCINLVTVESYQDDKPVWEQTNLPSHLEQKAFGPIERLTWLSRLILLLPERDGDKTVVRSMYFTQGRRADKDYSRVRDLTQVYSISNKKGILPYQLDKGRASWRDLHSLLILDPQRRNKLIHHVGELIDEDVLPKSSRYRINIVGIVANQAAPSLHRHDRMNLPAALLTSEDMLERLEQGINYAEAADRKMLRAKKNKDICDGSGAVWKTSVVFLLSLPFTSNGLKMPILGKSQKGDVYNLAVAIDPRPNFWAQMETHFDEFVQTLNGDETSAYEGLVQWKKCVDQERRTALRDAFAKLGNSTKAIRAVALAQMKQPKSSEPSPDDDEMTWDAEENEIEGGDETE